MPQRPKDRVRRALTEAALGELAQGGFDRTTLAAIAERAGTSVGNLYKYFPNKAALFAAAIPSSLVDELSGLLRARIEAFGGAGDASDLATERSYAAASDALLDFAIEHRAELVFLLLFAQGTSYAGVPEALAQHLAGLAARHARRARPPIRLTTSHRRTLARIYRAFVRSIAVVLSEEPREDSLREAIADLTVYHLAGLRAFFEAAACSQRRRPA